MLADLEGTIFDRLKPVAQEEICIQFPVDLAQERLQVVSAVAVQEHNPMDTASDHRLHNFLKESKQSNWRDIDGERKLLQVAFRAEGNRGED
jgi:hypothetical protein